MFIIITNKYVRQNSNDIKYIINYYYISINDSADITIHSIRIKSWKNNQYSIYNCSNDINVMFVSSGIIKCQVF